eukprot:1469307-Pyramimonas_sp.AAC.1
MARCGADFLQGLTDLVNSRPGVKGWRAEESSTIAGLVSNCLWLTSAASQPSIESATGGPPGRNFRSPLGGLLRILPRSQVRRLLIRQLGWFTGKAN